MDLYWSNLTDGPGNGNVLLSSVGIVDGKIVDADAGSAVPEPASLALLGLGLVGVGIARRNKAKSA